jgi:hypothetical protein
LLHDFELAGFDGDVIEKDGSDDDPNDFEETESGAVKETGNGQEGRHLKGENGHEDGGPSAGNGAKMSLDAQAGQKTKKDKDRESGY